MLGLGLSSRANLLTNNGLSSKVNPVCLKQPRKPVGNPNLKPSRKPAVKPLRKTPRKTSILSLISTLPGGRRRVWVSMRIRELLARLGDPQNSLRIVHVAGTNGKGSTCAYIANVLQAAGYRVGWFSSPFIERFEERIRVDGKNIGMPDLARVTLQVREHAEQMSVETGDHPTEFELMTAVALLHFAQVGCQVAVLEVGLGGRLDSTNVIAAPDVAVITRIGLDHTDLLGDTIGKIAAEKAGIIKPGSSVVSWPQEPDAAEAVEAAARAAGCTVAQPDFGELDIAPVRHLDPEQIEPGKPAVIRPFTYKGNAYETTLLGSYQPQNAALALEAVLALQRRGWDIPQSTIERGVAATRWAGRFEVLPHVPGKPTVVIDGGHNPQGAQALADSLADVFAGRKAVLLSGVMADKDHPTMLRTVLPHAGCVRCRDARQSPSAARRRIRRGSDPHSRGIARRRRKPAHLRSANLCRSGTQSR